MPSDMHFQKSVVSLVIRHGARAPAFAAMVARELLKVGDIEESEAWRAMGQASESLLNSIRSQGLTDHSDTKSAA